MLLGSPLYTGNPYTVYIYIYSIHVCMYVCMYIYMGLFFMGLWDLQDGKPKDHFQDERNIVTGWWFGTELDYFSIQSGISSSQLTFTPSFFRGVGIPPTSN